MRHLKPYFEHTDARGVISGIVQNDICREINYITSKKGVIRGNHFHKNTAERFFIISGIVAVAVESMKTKKKTKFMAKAGDIFTIEPYEHHTFKVMKDASWINMLSKPINAANPDIHRP